MDLIERSTLQVATLHALRPLRRVTVWARRPDRARRLAGRLSDRLAIAGVTAGHCAAVATSV
jgi:ornithine cyclodeaminase/alanine dehydrogenase-like protein (mu-crystallin family)